VLAFSRAASHRCLCPSRTPRSRSRAERASSVACSIQVRTAAAQPVACPALPKCKLPAPTARPSAAPTPYQSQEPTESPSHYDSSEPTVSPSCYDSPEPTVSPSHYDSPEPTVSPSAVSTPEATVNNIYNVGLESGPISDPPSCLDAYLKVTVLHNGIPVPGR
jgi:hypothetical protein